MILILRKENECLLQLVIAVSLTHLGGHNVLKVVKIYRHYSFLVLVGVTALSILILPGDQPLDFLFRWLKSQRTQCHLQVLNRDIVVPSCVKQIESFLDLFKLILSQFLLELLS